MEALAVVCPCAACLAKINRSPSSRWQFRMKSTQLRFIELPAQISASNSKKVVAAINALLKKHETMQIFLLIHEDCLNFRNFPKDGRINHVAATHRACEKDLKSAIPGIKVIGCYFRDNLIIYL